MRRILTIDFDCIMSPCIKLYNEKCVGNENATVIWNRLSNELDINNFLCYDAHTLESITLLIQRSVGAGAKLIPIENHHEIIKELNLASDEKIDLVNIDFHHDIWYNTEAKVSLSNFDTYNCADWVGYLMHNNNINSYEWYKMPNSDMFNEHLDTLFTVKSNRDIKDIDEKFDAVYFCLSPQWVPYKYHHLYDLIVKLFGGTKI